MISRFGDNDNAFIHGLFFLAGDCLVPFSVLFFMACYIFQHIRLHICFVLFCCGRFTN